MVRNLDQVIDWSIRAHSTIGYFAVLYKKSTLAVRNALVKGKFRDAERMQRFDAVFAQRYFDALNAYFHPSESGRLTLPWEVAFVGHTETGATMLQHMVAGLSAHINFDLGIAAVEVTEPAEQGDFEYDFNLINDIVAEQIRDMLDAVERLSPGVLWLRRLIPNEVRVIGKTLVAFRTAGFRYAAFIVLHPDQARERTVSHEAWTAIIGDWYLHPTKKRALQFAALPMLVRTIAKRENPDVAANLRALDAVPVTRERVNA
ncbi:hypothetical protein AFA91_05245 [Mycolicibacterium goodii]|uniref:Uncharacterized protein n=1 Tax=Mycolicibacterium goodii TaxID=134601 RepID=A0A0K0X206_MYCGD|nr:hypothetical protein AFA91_05245 [Mycolicibacterium goodii]